ncbi:A/G-specific adenine glycosylase [Flavobacterium cyanobacteriorum]|uniref:Adenine DNA glycosylase n=1 Tax=Flavobacterium cyanobacteriorum TaxID=2022802 RepID=A0A255ZAS5_9FLAO|nr:A/G-specific adenine glycosylase [Flavobacterium cyanobacteriorum]OYQ38566.1 A/G-specific adenine glycosylase [Flavobacterium cyanobacteriorum]
MSFSKYLIQWYLQNRRNLPWRKTTDPYPIWLSEIMLQQTRVAQGLPYFQKFMQAFPTVHGLAAAPEEQVLKLWQGLGYYSRARNLHATAKYIAYELEGKFPPDYNGLLKLKGVGEYTAAAIASIAYGEPVPVVDGNVYRVLARYFGIETDISSSGAKKQFTELAASLLPKAQASAFNQAMMEFGALQCVPKNPDCTVCIFNAECAAFLTGRVNALPVKLKKTKVINRYFNYIIVKDVKGRSIINKRSGKGIWHNLYEFPLLEAEQGTDNEDVQAFINSLYGDYGITDVKLLNEVPVVHKLSHQHLHIRFWEVFTRSEVPGTLDPNVLKSYPFPVVIYNFIEKYWGST